MYESEKRDDNYEEDGCVLLLLWSRRCVSGGEEGQFITITI